MTTSSTILILHEVGDLAGGAPWRDAFATGPWTTVLAPDLPGHGSAPAPSGGNYGMSDPIYVATRLFADLGIDEVDVVVGSGVSGWSAQLLALAGRTKQLVLVDGLGDPFLSIDELLDRRMDRVRTIADSLDPLADAPPSSHGDRELAETAAAETSIPVLLVGTGTAANTALNDEFIEVFPDASQVTMLRHDPHVLADIITTWSTAH